MVFATLAPIKAGKGELISSRNGNYLAVFTELPTWIAEHLRVENAVLDGEITCLDESGVISVLSGSSMLKNLINCVGRLN
jgi:ATP-dependent DNA ligase